MKFTSLSSIFLSSLLFFVTQTSASKNSLLAGQRVVFSYPGATVPNQLLDAITAGNCSGVIFFGENIQNANLSQSISQLNLANSKGPNAGQPLLLMTDQEGGEVRRLPGAPVNSAKTDGASSNPSKAASASGTGAGQNLKANGMNLNLAPILGVYRKAGDFLDNYDRSYSMNASIVSQAATSFITGQQALNVAATAKHFPGLGAASTNENTDAQPVTINVTSKQLTSIDMLPYRAAISTGQVKLVMPSWALYPSIDPDYPSGLSRKMLQTYLRGQLGFKGVTISDAIEAGGLNNFGSDPGVRSKLAVEAGMDIILAAARDVSQGVKIVEKLTQVLNKGGFNATEFQESVDRIAALRKGLA